MTDHAERYDRIAAGYAQWWAPVLAPAVDALLDRMGTHMVAGTDRVLDVGTGTGQLGLGALERWPAISVVGVDPSGEMCAMAEAEADRRLPPDRRPAFRTEVAFADRLPFGDRAFDLGVSSFVLQLVPNRHRALREILRVLRPGGAFEFVSWVADDRSFEPDAIFDDLLDEIGVGAREPDGRSGDFHSVERAGHELRRAGFREVAASGGTLTHRFTVDGFISFMVEFDEETLMAELEPGDRSWLLDELRSRLAGLSDAAMTMHFPIVFASARRSER
jgi:ubiquinone/menaquinone biosynthesis C-methylase UbiE